MADAELEYGCAEPASRRSPLWFVGGAFLVLAVAAWVSATTAEGDNGADLLALVDRAAHDARHLRLPYLVAVIVLAGLHYAATAVAARAASGLALPFRETLRVQLAAAAANRLTPAGLGGAALTARYFTRRGLDVPAALGAVAALAAFGGMANLLVVGGLVVVGSTVGLHGSTHEFAVLTRHVTQQLGSARSPWLWAAVVVMVFVLAAALLIKGRSPSLPQWKHVVQPLRELKRHPRTLATLLLSSGCTTLILAFAFVATTKMVPGPAPVGGLGALLTAFMLGSAAGTAVPLPAGLGSSEAAFLAVLISVHVPSAQAFEEVLIFRVLTFWAPAALGVFAARSLHRADAL